MANTYKDRSGWIVEFRGLTGRRRTRVPHERTDAPSIEEERTLAQGYADECERYCRILMGSTLHPEDIAHAERLKAITASQADALRGGMPCPPPTPKRGPVTVLEAAGDHPATKREYTKDPIGFSRHRREVLTFCEWAKITYLKDLRLSHVEGWLKNLEGEGLAWDTRRHKILWIRRAAAMAPNHGLTDVLHSLKLDRRETSHSVEGWTLAELASGIVQLEAAGELRTLALLALGGFVGLRTTEIGRLRVEDFDFAAAVLEVGVRDRKTAASRRNLALPALVNAWCQQLAGGKISGPLFPAMKKSKSTERHINDNMFGRRFREKLATATGRDLAPKCLRKSFVRIALDAGLAPRDVESFLGHHQYSSKEITDVTLRHYWIKEQAEKLRPAAVKLNEILAKTLREIPTTRVIPIASA